MIRIEAGMSTTRFCQLIEMPERTWRRWQARARAGAPAKGPWPRPARVSATGLVRQHALEHPAWGHRKIWAMVRHEGHVVSEATVLRILRDQGLILPAHYQRERRQLAQRRKAAFATQPTGANQVWQLDFSELSDHHRRHLAAGRLPRLLEQVRASLPHLTDREPARRDRRDRTRVGRLRGDVRPPHGRCLPGRCGDRRAAAGGHHRHRQRRPVPLIPPRAVECGADGHRAPQAWTRRPRPSPSRWSRRRVQ